MYNPSIRRYLSRFIDFEKSKLKYVLVSLIPFFLICSGAAFYPNIMGTLNLFGFTVYNFNGYILPFMMYIATLKREK